MKHNAKWLRGIASLLIALFLGACGSLYGGREPVSIAVTKNPSKTAYSVGAALDLTGLEVTASYGDGSTELITYPNENLSFSGLDTITATTGKKTITVIYGGKSAAFTVTVNTWGGGRGRPPQNGGNPPPALVSIAVTSPPAKTEYDIDASLDLTGLEVTANYDDSSTEILANDKLSVSGFESSTVGVKTVTVAFGGKSDTFMVTVKTAGNPPPALVSIAVTSPPAKTEYDIDASLDLTGLEVTANYDDSSTEIIANDKLSVSGFESSAVGVKTVTVTFGGKTAVFTVTVSVQPGGVNLTMNDITIKDEGAGLAVFDIGPVSLSKSGAVKEKTFTFNEPGCTAKAWRVGNINLGNTNSVTLKAPAFNNGKYTLTLEFTKGGKSWLAGLDFAVAD